MSEIDKSRLVYVNLSEHEKFKKEILSKLLTYGFDKKQIILEPANRFAQKDDYAVEIVSRNDTPNLVISRATSVQNINIITQKERSASILLV